MRILVIEDEPQLARHFTRALMRHGHDSTAQRDGAVGLQSAIDHPPDLIVLDLNLPSLDGFAVLAGLRERKCRARVLILKYKFTPQIFGALRWNQQLFDTVPDGGGGRASWGQDLWRIDTALGYRFTAHTQFKLQYSLQHEDAGPCDLGNSVVAQFTLRF